jgi:hypothetical protein
VSAIFSPSSRGTRVRLVMRFSAMAIVFEEHRKLERSCPSASTLIMNQLMLCRTRMPMQEDS